MIAIPETRYAKAPDGLHLAYQVFGEGPLDLVFISEWTTHVEVQWEHPPLARFLERLASFSRVIVFDKRGMGLSDPLPLASVPTLERGVEDVSVVMDAAGSRSATVFATAGAGPMALVFAATHPGRTSALVLANTFARLSRAPDYPIGVSEDDQAAYLDRVEDDWGTGGAADFFVPSRRQDASFRSWLARYRRLATSPGMGMQMQARFYETDVREVLPIVTVPTLVLHRGENQFVPAAMGRHLAKHIGGARYVELTGDEHLYYVGDSEALLGEVEEFLTGSRGSAAPDRVLATVLYTDIVGSTSRAAELGDARWRELLDGHDSMIRRQLDRFRGQEVKSTGDGFLTTFDGPARAINAAIAMRAGARALGIEIRAGLHAGEIELRGNDIGGIAVHVAQRVLACARPGEIAASSTVRDLVIGSGIDFEQRGSHQLKGVPGEWTVFEVTS